MTKQNRSEKQIEKTLKAFKTDVPPEMDPWFYERLTNKIRQGQSDKSPDKISWFAAVLKPGMLLGLVALNILMMVWISMPTESVSSGSTNYLESLSSQYGLNYSDTYLLSESGE